MKSFKIYSKTICVMSAYLMTIGMSFSHVYADNYVIQKCVNKNASTQVCTVSTSVGEVGEEVSIYNKSTWVGAGKVLSSRGNKSTISIEESFSKIKPGFAITVEGLDEDSALDSKHNYSLEEAF